MTKENIAKVELLDFDGSPVESIFFTDKIKLIDLIVDNIEVGRPYKITKIKKDLVLNLEEFY